MFRGFGLLSLYKNWPIKTNYKISFQKLFFILMKEMMVYLVKSTLPKKDSLSNPLCKQLYVYFLMDTCSFSLTWFILSRKKKSCNLTEADILNRNAYNPWETWSHLVQNKLCLVESCFVVRFLDLNPSLSRKNKA